MGSRLKIAVIYGGWSSEAQVSQKSAKAVARALKNLGYEVIELPLTRDIALKLYEIKPDLAFPVLHGKPGEDGSVQGLLEIAGIPYVGEGVKTSSLCMDKDWTKRVLKTFSLPTPNWIAVSSPKEAKDWKTFPAVVKPAQEGSSIGLNIVKNPESLENSVKELLKRSPKVLVEEFIPGREFTAGYVKGRIFKPLEIKPKRGIYDYSAKYTKGETQFLPVKDPSLEREIKQLTQKVVKALEIKQLCRVDFRYDGKSLYVLEINTIPGMTETSLLPLMAQLDGLSFEELVNLLVVE